MKNTKIWLTLTLMNTALGLFSYAEFELAEDLPRIHRELRQLSSECNNISLVEGKKKFADTRKFYHTIYNRAHNGGCIHFSSEEKEKMFLDIFTEQNNSKKTLAMRFSELFTKQENQKKTLAMTAKEKSNCSSDFCAYLAKELEMLEEETLKKSNEMRSFN